MESFKEVKQKYTDLREAERRLIIEYLDSKGFEGEDGKLTNHGGKGDAHYNSQGRLKTEHNLSNWKYVEALKSFSVKNTNGRADNFVVKIFISLQAFERDKVRGNRHVLFDRIGIHAYMGKYNSEKVFSNMKITEIELPLDKVKLESLLEEINNLSLKVIKKSEKQISE